MIQKLKALFPSVYALLCGIIGTGIIIFLWGKKVLKQWQKN